ncbi:MAG: ParA family protein, partial [Cytophagaceae bacterium]
MPTIVFASPKGGAGKSTSAVVLACQLAQGGADAVIIERFGSVDCGFWTYTTCGCGGGAGGACITTWGAGGA